MKSKEEYWERLFKGYERSGLSQEEFCSEQGIPIAQFKYQWRKRTASGSQKADSQNKPDKPSHFEPILISSKDSVHQETQTSQSIIIQFPNQISCEVKMDIKSKDFSSLLNQKKLNHYSTKPRNGKRNTSIFWSNYAWPNNNVLTALQKRMCFRVNCNLMRQNI
jgi:hypothetical protein